MPSLWIHYHEAGQREQGLEIWVLVLGKGKLRLKHEAQAPARLFQIPFWGLRS